jgi:vitamin B12 transporter
VLLVTLALMPLAAAGQDVTPSGELKVAQDVKPEAKDVKPEIKKVEPVIVTATKVETPQREVGAAVTVITEDDVRTYNYSGIEEALRNVPGVEIQRSGSLGKTTSLKIRGAGAQQVIVLVDGMRVSSPTLGTTELSDLTLDGIDRIEIVRGPQSTLYGADAIGGVVNIITKKGQGPIQGSLWVEGGSYGTVREQANVQGSYGGFNFNLSGSRYDTGGHFNNDDSALTSFNGRIGYDFPWKGELSVTGRYTKLDLGLPVFSTFPTTVFDPNARSQSETYFYTATYKQPVLDWWDVSLRYGQWWNNAGFQNRPPPGTFTTISQIDTRRQETEVLSSFRIGSWNVLTAGYENRAEQGVNRGAFSAALETNSGYLQDEVRILDRLFITGGLRYDANDTFGSELTPRVSAALVIKETGTKLRASWGKGFRTPTINDLFFPGFGNPNLQPEHSESYDAGLDQKLWQNRIRFGSTFFHNHFNNLIQIFFDPVTFLALPINVGRAITEGVETYVEVEPLDWLLVWANHTYTRTEDLATGRPLRRFAPNRWNAGVTVTPIERLTLFVQANVVSKQFESPTVGYNQGYYRLDIGGTLRLLGRVGKMDRLDLTARIDNVTDNRYEEVFGFRALGFNALVGLRAFFK